MFKEQLKCVKKIRELHLATRKQRKNQIIANNRKLLQTLQIQEHSENKNSEQIIIQTPLKKKSIKKSARYYYSHFMQHPEWMNQVPNNLMDFFFCPKPDGQRILLYTSMGMTISRDKYGNILHKFFSYLPKGGYDNVKHQGVILEGIWNKNKKTYYILDVLRWLGVDLAYETYEKRQLWLRSNMYLLQQTQEYRIQLIQKYRVTVNNLIYVYQKQFDFRKDGFLFYHSQSYYQSGINPNVLLWKDHNTSKYPIDTMDGVTILPQMQASLLVNKHYQLCTRQKIILHTIEKQGMQIEGQAQPGQLWRVTFTDIKQNLSQQPLYKYSLENLQVKSKCSPKKNLPDSFSRILFQFKLRYDPILFKDIFTNLNI